MILLCKLTHSRRRLAVIIALLFIPNACLAFNSQNRIDFWQKHFVQVAPDSNERARWAHQIFKDLVQIAGTKPGIIPKLMVIQDEHYKLKFPVAIPDGWIVISEPFIASLDQYPQHRAPLLAFVLGHELAHQLEDDFWHLKYFEFAPSELSTADPVRQLSKDINFLVANELRADEKGVIYAAIAGYDIASLLQPTNDGPGNESFLKSWFNSLHGHKNITVTHPDRHSRYTGLRQRFQQVTEHGLLFQMANWFYLSGNFRRAIELYERFVQHFPEQAAHLNLATAYHQLAIQNSDAQHLSVELGDRKFPYRLELMLDPNSNALLATNRGANKQAQYVQYRDMAIKYYEIALSQDKNYVLALNNLANLYLMDGQPYHSIPLLKNAIDQAPARAELHSHLAIAFALAENDNNAQLAFAKAESMDNTTPEAALNYGLYLWSRGKQVQAKESFRTYLHLGPKDPWSAALASHFPALISTDDKTREANSTLQARESLGELSIGLYLDELEVYADFDIVKSLDINDELFRLIRFADGLYGITIEDEVRLVYANQYFRGQTAHAIQPGDNINKVQNTYGHADFSLNTVNNRYLVHLDQGLAVQTKENEVAGLLLFWD